MMIAAACPEAIFQSNFRYPKLRLSEFADAYQVTWCINEGMLTRPFSYVQPKRPAPIQ